MANVGELPEIKFIRGDDMTYTFAMFTKYEDGEKIPYDLSVMTNIKMDFRTKPTKDGVLVVSLSLDNGITILGDGGNIVAINLSDEQTSLFEPNELAFVTPEDGKRTGSSNSRYYTDIVFSIGSEIKTLLKAKVLVTANITDQKGLA